MISFLLGKYACNIGACSKGSACEVFLDNLEDSLNEKRKPKTGGFENASDLIFDLDCTTILRRNKKGLYMQRRASLPRSQTEIVPWRCCTQICKRGDKIGKLDGMIVTGASIKGIAFWKIVSQHYLHPPLHPLTQLTIPNEVQRVCRHRCPRHRHVCVWCPHRSQRC